MTAWTPEELTRIDHADELRIQPRHANGSRRRPTTIWVVRDGDSVFVRTYNGPDGAWFRTATASHRARIDCGGMATDVTLTETGDDSTLNDRIDAAYRSKYARYSDYVPPMTAEGARTTTLQLTPTRD